MLEIGNREEDDYHQSANQFGLPSSNQIVPKAPDNIIRNQLNQL
jgi:hypothetical protein